MKLNENTRINLTFATLVFLLLFAISSAFAFGGWAKKVDATIEIVDHNTERIECLETSSHNRDVQYAEIQKDLKYIILRIDEMGE